VNVLILGAVRSGKSRQAGEAAGQLSTALTLIATGTALDEEMAARIESHRRERPAHWVVVEEPVHLGAALRTVAADPDRVIVVDCLTLWLSNLLCSEEPDLVSREIADLFDALPALRSHVVFVANEVGLGIMPVNALARRFADEAGTLHQRLAGHCERVVFMVAGLPLTVKPAAGAA
jgi:adenosylcobinamide kinase / adenosylcobinamide-phosphate guanylyltransferase